MLFTPRREARYILRVDLQLNKVLATNRTLNLDGAGEVGREHSFQELSQQGMQEGLQEFGDRGHR